MAPAKMSQQSMHHIEVKETNDGSIVPAVTPEFSETKLRHGPVWEDNYVI